MKIIKSFVGILNLLLLLFVLIDSLPAIPFIKLILPALAFLIILVCMLEAALKGDKRQVGVYAAASLIELLFVFLAVRFYFFL